MEANDLSDLEIRERRKVEKAILTARLRKKILLEKMIPWVRRHPIVVGVIVFLVLIQFINAYYNMDRMDRKATAQSEQSPWRKTQ